MNTTEPDDPQRPAGPGPITEADLHGYVDRQLPAWRVEEVERHLAVRPDERARVDAWRRQNELLHGLLDPVLGESLPARLRLLRAAAPSFGWGALAAGVAIALVSAGAAWLARGEFDRGAGGAVAAARPAARDGQATAAGEPLTGFALRAAVAYAVYSPEVRRPVEVGAEQEQQLVAWLSKRLGTPIRAPLLKPVGYDLIGGRLLPGETGPVALFMYHDDKGQRLTLYVTREPPKEGGRSQTAFRFGNDGAVNVFYWVDKDFGYALSGGADRQELTRVAKEIYRQLGGG